MASRTFSTAQSAIDDRFDQELLSQQAGIAGGNGRPRMMPKPMTRRPGESLSASITASVKP